MLSDFQFGNSKCAVNLASILREQHPELIKRVVSFVTRAFTNLKEISVRVPEYNLRKQCGRLCKNEILFRLDRKRFPTLVDTHIRNLIVAYYKKYIVSKDRCFHKPGNWYLVKPDGDNCPFCKTPLSAPKVSYGYGSCENERCYIGFVAGLVRLTKAEKKRWKPFVVRKFVIPQPSLLPSDL